MKTVLVCNQKGGVGKSLVSDELAFSLERSGIAFSFYDLDGQGGTIHKTKEIPEATVSIVDTPAGIQAKMKEWIAAADVIVIPTRPTSRDMVPFRRMLAIVRSAAPEKPLITVLNGWQNRYKSANEYLDWMMSLGLRIYRLPQSELFVQAAAAEISVVEKSKGSPAATSIKTLCNAIREAAEIGEEK